MSKHKAPQYSTHWVCVCLSVCLCVCPPFWRVVLYSPVQGCIFFPGFLYPSLLILCWNYIDFIIVGGVHNYETFLLQIYFIIFWKLSVSCEIFTMLFQICLNFLISFPVLGKVLIDFGEVNRRNRKNIHPWPCISLDSPV